MRPNGVLLKQERMRRGMSQADLADAAEISRRTVQFIEAGKEGVLTSSIHAVADVLNIDHADAIVDDSNMIDNHESFSIWPWRLFEFLGKRMLPGELAHVGTRAEAESVVLSTWNGWLAHLSNITKTKTVRPTAIEKWNRKDFIERYLKIWETHPDSLMCSSVDGQRSGVSVLLPVTDETYNAFVTGQISCFDITADDLVEESQNLIYDCMVEFDGPVMRKRHHITNSISFISFFQIAVLSQSTIAADFRIATYGGAEENIGRMTNAGLIEADAKTPDFGDRIWEYSGHFEKGFHQVSDDVLDRSATGAHYVAMMKRWANSKARNRMKVKAARNAIHVYQRMLQSAALSVGQARRIA